MTRGRSIWHLACVTLAVSSVFYACSKSETPTPQGQPPLPAVTLGSIERAISAYDQIGKALANDKAEVSAEALTLAGAAKAASMTAPEALEEPLTELSAASERLATASTRGVAEARTAFGDVSRAMVLLLSKAPSLQRGLHLYECPMAEGYEKWVQKAEAVSNPYMGSKMPQCGTAADF